MDLLRVWLDAGSDGEVGDYCPISMQIELFLQACTSPESILEEWFPLLAKTLQEHKTAEEEIFLRARSATKLVVAIAVRCRKFTNHSALHSALTELLEGHIPVTSELNFLECGGQCTSSKIFPLHDIPPEGKQIGVFKAQWQRKTGKRLKVERKQVVWSRGNELSRDTLIQIFLFCDAYSLCSAAATCRLWFDAEQFGSNQLWNRLLLVRWPGTLNGGGKARYFKRLRRLKTRSASGLGWRFAKPVLFCAQCDADFTNSHHLARHVCKPEKALVRAATTNNKRVATTTTKRIKV